jgi:transposase
MGDITYVGLDAHKKAINVAMLLAGERAPVEWKIANDEKSVARLVRAVRQRAGSGEIRFCYEAGPCGYALQRRIESADSVVCEVIAPALIPSKPGEHIKTDRRDARKLAELSRAGLLTAVQPPTTQDEAVRDLARCREDVRQDLTRCRHRLGKLLLRRALRPDDGGTAWSSRHRKWLRALRFEDAADQAVFDDYLLAVEQLEERLQRLDEHLAQVAEQPRHKVLVGRLRCFHGIDTLTAMTFVAELYAFGRFSSPRHLMAYLGLVPKEHSSSERVRRSGITKAGNSHVRRLLIETAWQYRHRPSIGQKLRKRREGQPAVAIAIADKAHQRLNRRYRRMTERGKPANKVVTAVARELVGFLWAALQNTPSVPEATAGSPLVKDAPCGGAASGSLRESLTEGSARRVNQARRGRGTAPERSPRGGSGSGRHA